MSQQNLGGTYTFPNTSFTVHRMGYGAMQLAGPSVWGPPRDRAACVAVLHQAIEAGVNHIDTSDFYGPHITNEIIREALHPYPAGLTIVTKVGARRGPDKSWIHDLTAEGITQGIHDNLRNLAIDAVDIVNLRMGPHHEPVEEPMTALANLQQQGLIKGIGISNATAAQIADAQSIAPIVCVQNEYNLAKRGDDALIDLLDAQSIPYVPFFPLGGFSPLQSQTLDDSARTLGVSALQLALAWLLHRSPNMLLIPGTSSVAHLKENLAAATIVIPAEILTKLDGIGAASQA